MSSIEMLQKAQSAGMEVEIISIGYSIESLVYGVMQSIAYGALSGNDNTTPKFSSAQIPKDLPRTVERFIRREYFWYSVGWSLGTSKLLYSVLGLIIGSKLAGQW